MVLYRIVQEGLTNVLKHAQASKVSIVLEQKPDAVALVLEDDGVGFDAERRAPSDGTQTSGLGFSGMRERIALLSGTIAVESSPGQGSTIFVRIPIETGDTDK